MSLTTARQDLMLTLTNANIDVYYGWGPFNAPCARLFPGEPWVDDGGQLGGQRIQHWEIWAVAGLVDSAATFDDMEKLVQDINFAMEQSNRWSHIGWRRPTITDMSGGRYIACRGGIDTRMEV